MLEVEGLTVRFGDTVAVDDAALTVADGTVTAVMGPSGSGKSTLLRAVAGVEHLDAGTIRWNGEDVTAVPPHRRRFALMFQDYALFPHRSVAGNLAFGLRMQGWDDTAVGPRVEEILDLVGLSGLGGRGVDELSGGQQQRVALGRTLAPEPRLVLLDEPLGSIDRVLRDQLLDDMGAIFDRLATTVLYVTHDRDEAFAVADVVAVMNEGEIIRQDTPEGLWDDPGSAFVAGLLGLENVVEMADLTPWLGPAAPAAGSAVVPGRAVRLDDGGPVSATVLLARFDAGAYRITIRTDAGLVLHSVTDRRRRPSERVMVDVDRDLIRLLGSTGGRDGR